MDVANNEKMIRLGAYYRSVIEGKTKLIPKLRGDQIEFAKSSFVMQEGKHVLKRQKTSRWDEYFLDFDIDKSKYIIWDMLFLSKVIVDQISLQEKSNDQIIKQMANDAIKEISNKKKNVIISGSSYNDVILKPINDKEIDCEDKLKESIVIYQKTRDSMSHNNNSVCVIDEERQVMIINSTYVNNIMRCEIPLQYIEKFGNGIISLPEHREIAKQINDITSNIYFKLGFEMKEIPNFFSRTHPSVMKLLISVVDGDKEKLLSLPHRVFDCKIQKLEYLLDKFTIDEFNIIPEEMFDCEKERIEYFLKIFAKEQFNKLPKEAFYCKIEQLEYLLEIFTKEEFFELKYEAFYCSQELIKYLLGKFTKEDFFKLPDYLFYCKSNRLIYLLENFTIEELNKLEHGMFFCKQEHFDYLLSKFSIEELSKLKYYVFDFEKERIDYLLEKFTIDEFIKLPKRVLHCEKEQLEYLFGKFTIDELNKLSSLVFDCKGEQIDYLLEKFTIDELNIISEEVFDCEKERIEYLLEIFTKEQFNKLPKWVFYCKKERIDYLLEKFTIEEFNKLPAELFRCDNNILANLVDLHKENMLKSVFGMGNEKVIALILYMNSVFSGYSENVKCNNLDVSSMLINTLPSNIGNLTSSLERRVNALNSSSNENEVESTLININKEFVRIIRNCSVHTMRIFEKDKDTVVLEDYSVNQDGSKKISFRAEVKIVDLFNITEYLALYDASKSKITSKEICDKINLTSVNKYTVEDIDNIRKRLDINNVELKLLIKICLQLEGMLDVEEVIEDGDVYFKYIDDSNNVLKKSFRELFRYFKYHRNDIFNVAFMEYGLLISNNKPSEIDDFYNNKVRK